jgi:hypothetical protein
MSSGEFENLKVVELKKMAKDLGFTGISKFRKSELIDLLANGNMESSEGSDEVGSQILGVGELKKLKVTELKKMAKDLGFTRISKFRKSDLVDLLNENKSGKSPKNESRVKKCKKFFDQIINEDKHPDYLHNLTNISKNDKLVLSKCIQDYKKTHDKNSSGYVEVELFDRFLNPPLFLKTHVKKIKGPVAVHQMSHSEYPYIFYLFGDLHSKIGKCVDYTIVDWIKDTISNSPVFIDVYLESSFSYKKNPGYSPRNVIDDAYILDTYFSFENCFNKKSDPICKTSRFHYTDLRHIFESESQKRGYRLVRNKPMLLYPEDISDINSYIIFLRNKKSILYARIEKQFENITNAVIRVKLKNSFRVFQRKYLKNIKPIAEGSKDGEVVIFDINIPFFEYGIGLLDYYLIGRSFRTYKNSKKYSHPSYNNIIYTGDRHTNNYISILSEMGFVVDFVDKNLPEKLTMSNIISAHNFQCLNVSKMEQPMFHQRYK